MKYFVYVCLSALFFCCGTNDVLSQAFNVKVTVSEELISEPRWVYLVCLEGNQCTFEDSAFINKGQNEFFFNKEIAGLDEEFGMCDLLFAGEKPFTVTFFPQPGENIHINLSYKDMFAIGVPYLKAEGSPGSMELYDAALKQSLVRPIALRLRDSISKTTDETVLKELNDSLDYYKNYVYKDSRLEAYAIAKTPIGIIDALIGLRQALSMEEYDSLCVEAKQRFPNSKMVENFLSKSPSPPTTKESEQDFLRYRQLLNIPLPKKNTPVVLDTKLKKELGKIITYKTGDTIKNITLKGLNGKLVSLFDETTPYVLIDFWASWCGPCRGEIPGLKETLAKHKGLFSVYAISIDDDEKSWKSAIENDKTEVFTHVNARMKEREGLIITKQFGARAIPANFLLDKDHKIIAVNLFGKNLEKTISELQNKN